MDNWIQIGDDIDGESAGDNSGISVSLNSDGSTVFIGAIGSNNNAGQVRVFSLIPVEIQNHHSNNIIIYPNPIKNELNIEFKDNDISQIQIFDLMGKLMIEKRNIKHSNTINLSDFEKGIYFVNIHINNEIITKKIVKK